MVPRAAPACLAAALFGSCGPTDTPTTSGGAPPSRRSAGPPRVAWRDRDVVLSGLPAVAEDGSSVVVAFRDTDGGRGNPNLTLFEKDRGDRVLRRVEVLSAQDVERLENAEIAMRFDTASTWLEERHTAKRLVAMIPLEVHPRTDAGPAFATGPGLTLRWVPSTLTLELGSGAARTGSAAGSAGPAATQVVRTTPASWLVADRPMCATCTEICHNEAFLGGAYVDRRRRIAVVVVAYRGSDTCPEPGAQPHAVAW